MADHHLKIYSKYFEGIIEDDPNKRKTLEIRRNDRGYQVGDKLMLNEFSFEKAEFTNRWALVQVTHCLSGKPYVPDGYVAMSIRLLGFW